jgi:hypothetical protein
VKGKHVKADTLKADLRKAGGAGLLDTGGYHVEQVDGDIARPYLHQNPTAVVGHDDASSI